MNDTIGAFEELVLLAVVGCGNDATAREVYDALNNAGVRPLSIDACYGTFTRLEHKGFVVFDMSVPKKLHAVTQAGFDMLRRAADVRGKLKGE